MLLCSRIFLRGAGVAVLASFSVLASAALPYDDPIPVAKVVFHEPTHLPSQLVFMIDQPVANCAAGELLIWNGGITYPSSSTDADFNNDRKANIKAVSNAVLAAIINGVRLH